MSCNNVFMKMFAFDMQIKKDQSCMFLLIYFDLIFDFLFYKAEKSNKNNL